MDDHPGSSPGAAGSRLGRVLRGKYELVQVIGVGGMATVYEARHRNGHRFAIKILHAELATNGEIRTRFAREGYVANRIEHPGVVDIVDDDVADDGAPFVVMELLEGESVAARAERSGNRLAVPEALAVAEGVLAVLAAAHARGIVHRDIKPDNLFITTDGQVKVLDFGIARLREASGDMTVTGLALGTPWYMAPEQASGHVADVDGSTDLWALGATVFTLISAEHVHAGATPQRIVVNAATQPARSLATTEVSVHPAIVEAVDRSLAFEKSARFPDASSMRLAIREARITAFGPVPDRPFAPAPEPVHSAGPVAVGVPRAPGVGATLSPIENGRTRRPVGMVLTFGLLVALAAAGAWLLLPGLRHAESPGPVSPQARPSAVDSMPEPFVREAEVPSAPPAPLVKLVTPEPERRVQESEVPSAPAAPSAKLEAPEPERAAAPADPPVRSRPAARARPADRSPRSLPPLSPACSRLLERLSLGEDLSNAERDVFRTECRR